MAKFTFGNITLGIDMSDLGASDLFNYANYDGNSTSLKIYDDAKNFTLFTGDSFNYSLSDAFALTDVTGLVKGVTVKTDGSTALSATGLSVDAHSLAVTIFAGDDAGFASVLTAGSDTVIGTKYTDKLTGGAGNDRVYGALGADHLSGGTGADVFLFKSIKESTVAAFDEITDFSKAQKDKIDLTVIDANTKVSGDQVFKFMGTAAFDGKAGEVRYEKHGSSSHVFADVNGDKKADFEIVIDHVTKVTSDFFLL